MTAALSVIICTHNPRRDFLRRVLDALKSQTLSLDQWELLLVDNSSTEPLSSAWELRWHPHGRHIGEKELGLTPARLRGIAESTGELLVFVDDDNVLAVDYLESAESLFSSRPDLGVASGRLLPEYESSPPEWFRPYESWLAVRRIEKSVWSNFFDPRSEPCGSGMCVRRHIALAYAERAAANPRQYLLGRRGQSLLSGEDVAITKTALDLGFSMGQFIELKVLHLIPTRRVTESYLFSLYCHLQASGQLLGWLERPQRPPWRNLSWRLLLKAAVRLVRGNVVDRRLVFEEFRAFNLARRIVKESLGKRGRVRA